MEITFLGTSSMVPTKERNHSGIFLSYADEGILFDCGEGTQRQLRIAGIRPTRITKIVLTHWHGDHVLGLIGLVQTIGALGYDGTLKIFGPEGTEDKISKLMTIYPHDKKIDIEVTDVKPGTFINKKEYSIIARELDHTSLCLGYRFVEKDKRKIDMKKVSQLGLKEGPLLGKLQDGEEVKYKNKIIKPEQVSHVEQGRIFALITDTQLCSECTKIAMDADVLVCEATYLSNLEEKSEAHGHMTATQAASLANHANVKRLILTHFSQRYKTADEHQEEARTLFRNTDCAYDFMKVKM